jgi:radical SAM protein with 4Fe4S-binding SPASM domain
MPSLMTRMKHFIKTRALSTLSRTVSDSAHASLVARARKPHYPELVFVEPTTQCNLKCLHCGRTYWKERDQHRDIDFDLFRRTADELGRLGVQWMTIQGLGEPLLHPRIFDMIEHAQSRGIKTRFNTNFTVMSEEIAERLVTSHHSLIMVSIESIEAELFADIRRRGDLQTVLDNMRLLFETKQKHGSDDPFIEVNAVLLKSTLHMVESMVEHMRDLGVGALYFSGFNTDGIPEKAKLRNGTRLRDNSLSDLTPAEVDALVARIRALSTPEMPISIGGDLGGRDSATIPKTGVRTCRELWENPYIDSRGWVTPCCLLPDGELYKMGDLAEQSFEEIWHGEAYEELRRQHLTGAPPDVCKNCHYLTWSYDTQEGVFNKVNGDERYSRFFLGKKGASAKAAKTATTTTAGTTTTAANGASNGSSNGSG